MQSKARFPSRIPSPVAMPAPVLVDIGILAAALAKLGVTQVTPAQLLDAIKQEQDDSIPVGPNRVCKGALVELSSQPSVLKSELITNREPLSDAEKETRRIVVARRKLFFPDNTLPASSYSAGLTTNTQLPSPTSTSVTPQE
ncbi:hypothetical protein EIP91_003278 [Steccherinum ochraceum]|uniref:Uncharacterized protein n=1 Tax=Steccherinum ochraceum TaxID=92696 RepID=A0A4R0RDE0_9APHY|nr:hypothetical protein EIP91_003278 [Steccherinum ochraceum]